VTRSAEYDRHIQSKSWKRKAKAARKRAGWVCERCGVAAPLDVHHKTYARFKKELARDLEALCRPCHEAHHAKEGDMEHVKTEPTAPANGQKTRRTGWKKGSPMDLTPEFISRVKVFHDRYGPTLLSVSVPPQHDEDGAEVHLATSVWGNIAKREMVRSSENTVAAMTSAMDAVSRDIAQAPAGPAAAIKKRDSSALRRHPGTLTDLTANFKARVAKNYFTYGGEACAEATPTQDYGEGPVKLGVETWGLIARGKQHRAGNHTINDMSAAMRGLEKMEAPDPQEEQLPLARATLTGIQVARCSICGTLDLLEVPVQRELLAEINARYPR
tara:strand:+ start:764 stop:1750 length:987 start_codon:yes stop_codon:yes gene_type:complete